LDTNAAVTLLFYVPTLCSLLSSVIQMSTVAVFVVRTTYVYCCRFCRADYMCLVLFSADSNRYTASANCTQVILKTYGILAFFMHKAMPLGKIWTHPCFVQGSKGSASVRTSDRILIYRTVPAPSPRFTGPRGARTARTSPNPTRAPASHAHERGTVCVRSTAPQQVGPIAICATISLLLQYPDKHLQHRSEIDDTIATYV
jgi:hypothetical protein